MGDLTEDWGAEYVRIRQILASRCIPDSNETQRVASRAFAQLEARLQRLPDWQQHAVRHVLFESMSTKAALLQVIIDAMEGRCQSRHEAGRLGKQYIDMALSS